MFSYRVWIFMGHPCVYECFGCRCWFSSVVSRPKVSSSTVTFSPSQDLLCLTTMVWGSRSADDTRPSSVGGMWAGRKVTGQGGEMAADTGVTKPKGHEESHRDEENTGRVMEDNQRKGKLPWKAAGSCSYALSFCISLFHTWLFLTRSLCCSVGFGQGCLFPPFALWWRGGLWSEGAMKRWRPEA